LGVKADADKGKKKEKVQKLAKGEILMVNIGSTSTGARIHQVKGDLAKVILTSPVCTSYGEKLALSRRVDKHWRLIGWGKIRSGKTIRDEDGVESSSITTPGPDTLGSDKTLTPSDDLDELGRTVDAATSSMGNIDSTDSTSSTKTDDSDDIQKISSKKTKRSKEAEEDEEEGALDDDEEKTVSKKKVNKEKKKEKKRS